MIENVLFENIQYLNGAEPASIIRGYETAQTETRPRNIRFKDIEILGRKCYTVQDLRMIVELAHDIYIEDKIYCVRNKF